MQDSSRCYICDSSLIKDACPNTTCEWYGRKQLTQNYSHDDLVKAYNIWANHPKATETTSKNLIPRQAAWNNYLDIRDGRPRGFYQARDRKPS